MKFRSTLPVLLPCLVVAGLAVAACAPAEEPVEESAEMAMPEGADILADLRSQYVEHYNMGHADMVAALYTEDAVVLDADGTPGTGRDAVRAELAASMPMSPTLEIHGADRMAFGDVAVERGRYEVRMTPEEAEPIELSGHYLNVVERVDGEWRISWLATNYGSPPAAVLPSAGEGTAAEMMEETDTPEGIAALASAYEEHFNLGHPEMVADLYTEEAVAMLAERAPVEGRAAIATALGELMAEGSPQLDIRHAETRALEEGWVAGRGAFTLTATAEEGETSRDGHYLALYRQAEDGSWKIHWVLTNLEPAPTSPM